MDKYLCSLALIPIRKEPGHKSEQVSQMLFGEAFGILETAGNWTKIEMLFDGYQGWIESGVIDKANPEVNISRLTIGKVFTSLKQYHGDTLIVPAGAEIPVPDSRLGFKLGNKSFTITEPILAEKQANYILAQQFINAPYLWGGRTVFGIDCSGLVQVVHKILGVKLPRDASQQEEQGDLVKSIKEAQAGDLAFFTENSNITHVGIIMPDNKIIHASKFVRIDTIDARGIFCAAEQKYTHELASIKRLTLPGD